MNYILLALKGVLVGIANIIPGVSGGTMAVVLGIYQSMIEALAGLRRHPKDSIKLLAPLLLGMLVGIVAFAYAVEFLLREYTLPTAMAFIGMVLGGIPLLAGSLRDSLRRERRKLSPVHGLLFVALAAVVVCLPMLRQPQSVSEAFGTDAVTLSVLFVVGVVASATMVIPGISGSLVLMILGYYHGVLGTLTQFTQALRSVDLPGLLRSGFPLLFFGVGVLVGVFVIAKALRFLFRRCASITYSGIIGLVLASPYAVLSNTNALADLTQPGGWMRLALGVVLLVLLAVLTNLFARLDPHGE